ncbi:MFS transporter [Promethearchaeum syntrophicum]|uniref:MFS transporter n=1 Tax=Promethearchaeum syntrophicum TaxID=2594042 RepID=A0A5B9DAZ9_9ARCH|nr:MFS transporter [Candidatus Prometheoarchaeum syntrophicum]QEE16165.1 putative symporter YagG [Candidatus Prometheoarchaeum syntrophicum]
MGENYNDEIPRKTKWAFGLIGTASSALEGTVFGSITFFYNIKLGLSSDLIGIAWLIFGFWNAINDPLFGILEERTKTKIGRRIPYIRYGAFIYGFLFILSWFPFFGNSQTALVLNFIVVLFVFDSIFTLVGLVTYSLPAEMAITAKSRANLGVYTTILGALGVLVSMALPMFLLTGETTELDPAFRPAMIIVGIISSVIMFVGSYFLYENDYTQKEDTLGIIDSLKACLKNKPFLIFESSNFMWVIGYTTLLSGIFYYIQFILQLEEFMAMVPIVIVFLSLFIFTFVFSLYISKYGLKKIQFAGLLITSIIFLIAFFLANTLVPAVIIMIFIGIGFAARVVSEQPIMGDLIDYDETLTGKRRETTYAGINALFMKPSISIANWLYLTIFTAYGFDETLNTQTDHAKDGIMLGFFLVPAIFFFIATILFLWYPLHGKEWNSKKEDISKIHIQKENDYLEYLKNSKSE